MEKKLDLTKPVQTRDGRKVTIYTTEHNSQTGYSIVGAILDENGSATLRQWRADGLYSPVNSPNDLVNVPTKRSGWMTVYDDGSLIRKGGHIHSSKEQAELLAGCARVACVFIEWDE
jgi:hypothetical protein